MSRAMEKSLNGLKGLGRLEKAAIITALIIFLSLGTYLWLSIPARPEIRLANFSENKIKDLVKEKANLDIQVIKINKRDGSVSVIYFDDTAFDEKAVVYIAARDSKTIMSLLFGMAGVNKVKVTQSGSFLSDSGERDIEPTVSITLTRDKADKIDWNTVNTANKAELIGLASDVYINPAIKEQIDAKDILDALAKQRSSH